MNSVNKTLYIPLYGKSYVSKRGLFLSDKKAEEIWEAEGFSIKGKSKSKWLAYYMGVRSAVFDEWLKQQIAERPDATILHIGCGMDSRVLRVKTDGQKWYDVDFPEVIEERKRYFRESENYKMISADARKSDWLDSIGEKGFAIVVMEGLSMYLTPEEMQGLTKSLCDHFENLTLLADCYTSFAAKMSKHRNPINDVGVTEVYGIDDPSMYQNEKLSFVKEQEMTPQKYIDRLHGAEKLIFSKLYAGSFAKKLYRLYEYKKV